MDGLPADEGRIVAGRDPGIARIAAKVHMHFDDPTGPGVEPEQLDEVRAVGIDRLAVEGAVEAAVQRLRKPRRAIDESLDLVRELLPTRSRRASTDRRGGFNGRSSGRVRVRSRTGRHPEHERRNDRTRGEYDGRLPSSHDLLSLHTRAHGPRRGAT